MTPLLEIKNVTKVFGGGILSRSKTVAVDDVSLSIRSDKPKITCIAGESGSGKTTLARILLNVTTPTLGSMLFNGKDVSRMSRSDKRIFRRQVQPVFQDPFGVYNPFYKVDHVLQMPIKQFGLARTKKEENAIIEEALESVGLRPQETLGRFPHQLSGGQRQRVMVARTLTLRPKLILADEPVSMVDASLRATILDSIRNLNMQQSIAVVYITHDLTTAYQMSDEILIMYRGSVVESGDVEQVIRNPKHPYTQLLVNSIPRVDPDQNWYEDDLDETHNEIADTGMGCKFAPRCPFVMDICKQKHPPTYKTDRNCACYLCMEEAVSSSADG